MMTLLALPRANASSEATEGSPGRMRSIAHDVVVFAVEADFSASDGNAGARRGLAEDGQIGLRGDRRSGVQVDYSANVKDDDAVGDADGIPERTRPGIRKGGYMIDRPAAPAAGIRTVSFRIAERAKLRLAGRVPIAEASAARASARRVLYEVDFNVRNLRHRAKYARVSHGSTQVNPGGSAFCNKKLYFCSAIAPRRSSAGYWTRFAARPSRSPGTDPGFAPAH